MSGLKFYLTSHKHVYKYSIISLSLSHNSTILSRTLFYISLSLSHFPHQEMVAQGYEPMTSASLGIPTLLPETFFG